MAKRFIRSDYIDEDNQSVKENTSKNKIFSPSINDVQPIMQNKAFNPTDYKSNNGSKNKIISPLGAVENTAPLPSINNKTYYSNKGTPIKFSSTADDKASKAGSVAAGLTNGASLGIIPKILDHFQPGMSQDAEESNKLAYNIGNMAGYLAPGIGGTKLVKPLLKGITNPLLNRVLEGAAVGAGMTGIEDKVNGKSWEDTGKDMGINAGIGAGADLLLHGLGKAIPKVISKFKPSIENNIAKDINIPSNEPKAISPLQNESSIKSNITPLETTKINPSKEIDYDKIDDPKVLEKHIAELETALTTADEPTGLKMNLQLFAAKKRLKKIQSKVYSNTFQKTDVLSQAEKELLNPKDFQYDVKTEKASLDEARKRIDANMSKEIINLNTKQNYSGSDVDTMMGILGDKYLKEARQTGNYSNAMDWLKNIRKAGTEGGRTVQAFAKYSRTKEGALVDAQRVVDNAEEGLKKTNPKLLEEINTEAKKVEDTLNTAHKDAVEEVAKGFDNPAPPKETKELLPSEMLANKIKSTVSPKSPQEKSLIDKMVSELFSVAKESPIDTKLPETKPSALSSVSEALNNRQLYSTVWNNAKKLVTEQFKDNPEAMAILNNYFEKGIKPPFSMSKFNTAFNQGIKDLNINMGEVVRNYYKTGTETKQGLIDYLVKKSGLSGDEAKTLANTIDAKFREVKKQKSEEYLKGIFKEKTPSKVSNPLNKIEALSNTGGFVNENYKNKVKEKLTPELRKLIGFNPKETVAKAVDKTVMSFEDIVKGGVGKVGVQRKLFLDSLKDTLNVNPNDAETILKVAEEEFNKLAKDKQTQILKNMFKEREKPQQKNMVDKVMELINLEAYNKEAIRDLIKEKKGLPVLDNSDIKYIVDHMDKANSLPEGSLEQRGELSLVEKLISNKEPRTLGEKIKGFRKNMMLFNPVTLITRNPGSNILLGASENIKDIPGTLLDKGVSKITGIRTTGLPEYGVARKGNVKGAKRGFNEFAYDIKNGTDTARTRGQMEIAKGDTFINPILKKIDNVVNLGLQVGDRPFFEAAFDGRLNELMKLNKVTEPTKEMIDDAMEIAKERVLQNDSKLSHLGGDLRRAINLKSKSGLGDIILPFTQTPGNVLDKAIDYSPIGLARAGLTARELKNFAGTADKVGTAKLQKKMVDQAARGIVGTGLLAGGVAAGKSGIATGKADSNKSVNEFNKMIGKQDYSLKAGDNYVSYDWAQPMSTAFAAGVDASKENSLGKGLASGVDTVFKQSFLRGISNLFGYGSPAQGFYKSILDIPRSFIPAVGGRIAKTIDPITRDTSSDNSLAAAGKGVLAQIPFASKNLPGKVNGYGEDVKNFGGNLNPVNTLLSPAYTSKYKPSKTDNMLLDVFGKTSDSEILPKMLEDTISYQDRQGKTQHYNLSASEKQELQKKLGQETKKQFDIIANKYNGDAEKTAKVLKSVKNDVFNKIRIEFLKGKRISFK